TTEDSSRDNGKGKQREVEPAHPTDISGHGEGSEDTTPTEQSTDLHADRGHEASHTHERRMPGSGDTISHLGDSDPRPDDESGWAQHEDDEFTIDWQAFPPTGTDIAAISTWLPEVNATATWDPLDPSHPRNNNCLQTASSVLDRLTGQRID